MASRTRAFVVALLHAGACVLGSANAGAAPSRPVEPSAVEPRTAEASRAVAQADSGSTAAGVATPDATPEDKALARKLGEQGFLLFDAGDYSSAAERFARALALYDAVTLRVARGRALERLGRLVAAAEEFRRAESQRPSPNEPPSFAAARTSARRALQEVSPRLAHLTVQLVNPRGQLPTDWSLRVGGQDWLQASVGVSRPFDPGQYVVVITLRDGRMVERNVVLTEGAHVSVTLELPAPVEERANPPAATNTSSTAVGDEPSRSNTPLLVATITTAVLTAGAIATGIVAWNKRDYYKQQNQDDSVADSSKTSLRDDAELWGWINTGLVVGAIGGAGVTVYYWLDSPDEGAASEHALSSPANGAWGVQWSGRF